MAFATRAPARGSVHHVPAGVEGHRRVGGPAAGPPARSATDNVALALSAASGSAPCRGAMENGIRAFCPRSSRPLSSPWRCSAAPADLAGSSHRGEAGIARRHAGRALGRQVNRGDAGLVLGHRPVGQNNAVRRAGMGYRPRRGLHQERDLARVHTQAMAATVRNLHRGATKSSTTFRRFEAAGQPGMTANST
jgi:hypothetical protein